MHTKEQGFANSSNINNYELNYQLLYSSVYNIVHWHVLLLLEWHLNVIILAFTERKAGRRVAGGCLLCTLAWRTWRSRKAQGPMGESIKATPKYESCFQGVDCVRYHTNLWPSRRVGMHLFPFMFPGVCQS